MAMLVSVPARHIIGMVAKLPSKPTVMQRMKLSGLKQRMTLPIMPSAKAIFRVLVRPNFWS